MPKGKFIVIDGTDGSGKGTQTDILIRNLTDEGYDVFKADFPVYDSFFGKVIAKYLNGDFGSASDVDPHLASIMFALDRWSASGSIRAALDSGKIVISNRYTSANMGHQAGKIKDREKRKEFIRWLEDLEFRQLKIPVPDLNIFLYVPCEIGQKLVDLKGKRDYTEKKRDIHESDIQHLKDAETAFLEIAKERDWEIIDCVNNSKLMPIEEISLLVRKSLKRVGI